VGRVGHAQREVAVRWRLEAEGRTRLAIGALFVVQVTRADVGFEVRGAFPVALKFCLLVVEYHSWQGFWIY